MRVPLQPPPGLNDDDTTFASPGAWSDGSNIRFVKERPETIGPWDEMFATLLTGVCRNIKGWTVNNGSLAIAFGTHSALQVWWNGSLSTITPTGLLAGSINSSGASIGYGTGLYGMSGLYGGAPDSVAYARTWSLENWGEKLLANPRGGTLYVWENDPTVLAIAVPNAPAEITCVLTTPERQVLALGCSEEISSNFNPLCLRACDFEDIEDWTTTPYNGVFEHILEGGGGGKIVAARMVGPYVGIWTNVGLHMGQFVGSPSQIYRFDPVANNCGLIGPNAVAVIGQTAYWVGVDKQFHAWSPGGEPVRVECPIHDDYDDHLVLPQADKIVLSEMSHFGELWLHYPDSRDGDENSRYLAVSVDKGQWFRGEMERTAFVDRGVIGYPTAADSSGQVWSHEHPNGEPVVWSIEMADTYIGEGDRVAEVNRFVPDFERQDQDIALTVTVRKDPRSTGRTVGPHTLTPTSTRKDFRVAGRIIAMAMSGAGDMRLGKPMVEFEMRGRR